MITAYSGNNKTESFKGKRYGRAVVTAYLAASATNTALAAADVDLQSVTIKAELRRNGQKIMIFNDNLAVLFAASNFYKGNWQGCNPAATTNTRYEIFSAAAVGVTETGQITTTLDFGGICDVSQGGEIIVSINVAQNAFSTNVGAATSYFTVDFDEVNGVEQGGVPQIDTQVISPNESSPSYSPGNGVKSVFFINTDKTSILTAAQVISNVSVDSNEKSFDRNYQQLLADRLAAFHTQADADTRCQSFCLLPYNANKFYNGVNIKPVLNTGNVVASKNYFVAYRVIPVSDARVITSQGVQAFTQSVQTALTA